MSIYIYLIIASLFWGLNVIVMKLLLKDIPFLMLASMRVLLSWLCLFFYIKMKHLQLEKVDHKRILIVSILGIYLNFLLTFYGMQSVKGIDNALINALSPSLTLIISYLFLHQRLKRNEIIAVLLSLFAFLLSIQFQIFSLKLGFYLMLLGILCYMISHVFLQKWHIHNSYTLVFYQLLIGFLFLFIHCLFVKQFDFNAIYKISLFYWLLFILISGIGFAYIQVIYMKSTAMIGALKTSFFLSFNPMITYIGSLFFLGEDIDPIHILSFIILLISIIIANKKSLETSDNNE